MTVRDEDLDSALYDDVLNRHALEDRDESRMLKSVAPIVAKLRQGRNYLEPAEFSDVLRFFADVVKDSDAALAVGKFVVYGKLEIVRVREGGMVTLSDLARKTGVLQRTLYNWVAKADLPFKQEGRKKLYHLAEITALLESRREE
jgi:hypothetical protein